MYNLSDDVAIVTGGTRGIGKAVSERLGNEGATVIANYHSNDDAAKTFEENTDSNVITRQFDVRDEKEVNDQFKDINDEFGSISILVNNAGIMENSPIIRTSHESMMRTIRTNLLGTFNCTKAAIMPMRVSDGGSIVNISSIVAKLAWEGQVSYSASKAGIESLTKVTANEYGESIRANAVEPGLVETELWDEEGEELEEMYVEENPMSRVCSPQEVSSVVAFLASSEASYINGEIIRVDGGQI